MTYRSSTLEALHKLSSRHREAVEAAERCGCFCCGSVFRPGEISEWLEERGIPGSTALCPQCGIDSVIPEGPDCQLDGDLLAAMHAYWFAPGFRFPWTPLVWRLRRRLEHRLHRLAWDLVGARRPNARSRQFLGRGGS